MAPPQASISSLSTTLNIAAPPPSAGKLQLELWRRILATRCQQIEYLTSANLSLYANSISLDLKNSRYNNNGNDEKTNDLATGYYSSHLISQHPSPPRSITASDVGSHLVALFYRSIDHRLSPDERKYGLATLKMAFRTLDTLIDSIRTEHSAQQHHQSSSKINDDAMAMEVEAERQNPQTSRIESQPTAYPHNDETKRKALEISSTASGDRGQMIQHEKEKSKEPSVGLSGNSNSSNSSSSKPSNNSVGNIATRNSSSNISNRKQNSEKLPKNNNIGANNDTAKDDVGFGGNISGKRSREQHPPSNHDNGADANDTLKNNQSPNQNITNDKEGEEPTKKRHKSTGERIIHNGTSRNGREPKSKQPQIHTTANNEKDVDGVGDKQEDKKAPANNEQDVIVIDLCHDGLETSAESDGSSSLANAPLPDEEQSIAQKKAASISNLSDKMKNDGSKYDESTVQQLPEKVPPAASNEKGANISSSGMDQPSKSIVQTHPKKTPPAALPPPITMTFMRIVTFLSDNGASGSIEPRQKCTLQYDTGYNNEGICAALDNKSSIEVNNRLDRFDPYWKVLREVGHLVMTAGDGKKTMVSTRTAPTHQHTKFHSANQPASCAVVCVNLTSECANANETSSNPWGVKFGCQEPSSYQTGDRRLLLRMLPLKRTEKDQKKSADTHKWPIGTFVQLSRGTTQQVLDIKQRRQQKHDLNEWKGLCQPLDLTSLVNAESIFNIQICTKQAIKAPLKQHQIGSIISKLFEDDDEVMRPFSGVVKSYDGEYYKIEYEDGDAEEMDYDEVLEILVKKDEAGGAGEANSLLGSYAIHIGVCEYISPDDLYNQLKDKIPKVSLQEAHEMAEQYIVLANQQTVSIDSSDIDDDDRGGDAPSNIPLTFSLLCPISKVAIETPVRGRHCKHMQCVDLKSFLHGNRHICGGRWRCGVCEDFVPVDDLVRCYLFDTMLQKHRHEVSGVRHTVSYRVDGTFILKSEKKKRLGSKKDQQAQGTASRPDVIDLL